MCCALFICFSRDKKKTLKTLKIEKTDISIIDTVEAVENTKQDYCQLLKHVEKDPVLIFKLPKLKLIIKHVEANEDGESCYQYVKLKHFLHEKGYLVNNFQVHCGMFR